MNKKELRSQVRQLKAEYAGQFDGWSAQICQKVRELPHWQRAHTILFYHALPDEPNLGELLETAFREKRRALLPVVVGDDLVLKTFTGSDSLRQGAFHIWEPTGEIFPADRYGEIDLALVPGMAFDASCHRLGRGRGYYDRLLPRLPRAWKLGVCFPFQKFSYIPSDAHDVAMDAVLE